MQNLLLGIAIGDAFGAGVEFQDRHWIEENVDFTEFVNRRHAISVPAQEKERFTKNYQAWDYTDDTEMTIGLIKALVAKEPFTTELLVSKWKEEYVLGIRQKGYGRNGHGSMHWYYSGEMTIEQVRNFQRGRNNPGNAPAMRAVPLGLLPEELINEYAAINAKATHPNVNAIISSQCIARAAAYLLVKDGDPEQVIAYCCENVALNEEYEAYLSAVDTLGPYAELSNGDFSILCGTQPIKAPYFLSGIYGVPSDSKFTTGCVLYVLKHSQDAMEALKMSVRLGGDVDSVASICTGVMAGKFGLDSLPTFMVNMVEGKAYIQLIAQELSSWIRLG